jgi:integrase
MGSLFPSTQKYVLEIRTKIHGATNHPFLFVDARSGKPLSHSALTKVFQDLSKALGFKVTAHLLRHSWNDAFSAEMDRKKVPEATEKKVRSYLQGGKETSNTAAVYTRRHVRETAEKILLKMQEEAFHGRIWMLLAPL